MRKSQLSESKQKLASCLPSGSDVCGAKLHEHPPESNAEKLAYSAEASRISMERSFMKIFPSLQTKNRSIPMQRTTLCDRLSGVSWRRRCFSERHRGGDYLPSLHSAPFATQKDTSGAARELSNTMKWL